ncbi:MAG: hypothetical protein JST92_02200 [Deltaproteobacteria bacterium]|nr:hypothetical protein [Deltaproteobacteria bacterium]
MKARLLVAALLLIALGAVARERLVRRRQVSITDPHLSQSGRAWLLDGEPFDGELLETGADGTLTVRPVRKGLVDGWVRGWYADGSPRLERAYIAGEKSGPQREWWPGGVPRMIGLQAHDLQVGELRTWYVKGQPHEWMHYAAGHEQGMERVWYVDGQVRANYEVKGGRRYGFVSPMACEGTTRDSMDAQEALR